MSLWQGKSRGNKSGYRVFVWVLKKFGVFTGLFSFKICCILFFPVFVQNFPGAFSFL